MPKKYPHIDDLEQCPHCESDYGFYTTVFAYGHLQDNRAFSDREPMNHETHDSLSYGKDSDYFCCECRVKIATIKSSPKRNESLI